MQFRYAIVLFSVLNFLVSVYTANILALLTSPSRSHHLTVHVILEELAKGGHNITVLSTISRSEEVLPKNYHHIHIPVEDDDVLTTSRKDHMTKSKNRKSEIGLILTQIRLTARRSNKVLKHSIVQNLMESDQKFELFFLDYICNDVVLGIAGHFRIPSVIFSLQPPIKPIRDLIGNPTAAASTTLHREPNMPMKKGFRKRFQQFIEFAIEFFITVVFHLFSVTLYEECFPSSKNFPTFDEVRANVSLVMVNTHFSEGNVRPLLPNLIEVGGIQLKEKPNPLPQSIQHILDGANDNGVIVFSLGANIESSYFSEEQVQIFFNVFSKMKHNIIWKWETDIPVGKPNNVHMFKWLPQADLLAQPQVRFFISHCGISGIYEAEFYGVPILGLPVIGDQPRNAQVIQNQGWARILNLDHLSETVLNESVQELLTNSTYKKKALQQSQLFRDRPMTPLQTAMYWIEYVVRYDGAEHMKSPAAHFNVFQKSSLDVIFTLVIISIICLWLFVKVLKVMLRYPILIIISVSVLAYYIVNIMRLMEEWRNLY